MHTATGFKTNPRCQLGHVFHSSTLKQLGYINTFYLCGATRQWTWSRLTAVTHIRSAKWAYLVACCRLTAASRMRDILTQWETKTQRQACVSAQCALPADGWYRCTKWLTISSSHTCLEGIPWLSAIPWSRGPRRFARHKGRAKSAYRPTTGRVTGVWFLSGSVFKSWAT